MKRFATLLSILICLTLAAGGCANDWPRFLGPNANGIAPDQGINLNWAQRRPVKLWQAPLGDDGYAGPAVAAGKVYIVDHVGDEDIVRALSLGTGEQLWQFAYRDAAKPDYGFTRATPAIADGKVYTFSRFGRVHCLNAETGTEIWTRDVRADFGGKVPRHHYSPSPIVDGDWVIVLPGGPDAAVVALHKDTGETIWHGGGSDVTGYATPVVATILGIRQYVVFTGVSLIGVATQDGKLLWRLPRPAGYDINAPMPLVLGDRIFIASSYGRSCAMLQITAEGPVIRWENRQLLARFTTPVLHNGYIYGVGEPDYLICLDPETGQVMWKQPGFGRGGFVLVDGVILALTGKTGDLVMVGPSANGYLEVGRFRPLGGQSWTAPIIAHGKVIIRNRAAIACFDLM